jgi:hypothetical protein
MELGWNQLGWNQLGWNQSWGGSCLALLSELEPLEPSWDRLEPLEPSW